MTTNIQMPTEFGFPTAFSEWRPYQESACEMIMDTDKRFKVLVCPTGFGKSLTYMAAAVLSKGRTVILTSTKGLQTQLMDEFGSIMSIAEIKGRNNYTCLYNKKITCELGICSYGMRCKMQGECLYFEALKVAQKAKIVITNYSYWMSQNEHALGLGDFDRIILDEAHNAVDHVINHIGITFNAKKPIHNYFLKRLKTEPKTIQDWKRWAEGCMPIIANECEVAYKTKNPKLTELKRLKKDFGKIVNNIDETWVWDNDKHITLLSPIWPAPYTESTLFLQTPQVILTSATIVRKTMGLLGIPPENTTYREYPHVFPIENRPLIHIPTVKLNYLTDDWGLEVLIKRIDHIIKERWGTKGIIHTVSYARRDLILSKSEYAKHMLTHQSRDTAKIVNKFKKGGDKYPILVSPSMITGWDFPGDECRWQIIVKVPYPNISNTIIKARSKSDKDFVNYVTMQQLIQATGRGCRSATDYCETFILDNNIEWFLSMNEHLTVDWFKTAYSKCLTLPARIALPKQRRKHDEL